MIATINNNNQINLLYGFQESSFAFNFHVQICNRTQISISKLLTVPSLSIKFECEENFWYPLLQGNLVIIATISNNNQIYLQSRLQESPFPFNFYYIYIIYKFVTVLNCEYLNLENVEYPKSEHQS